MDKGGEPDTNSKRDSKIKGLFTSPKPLPPTKLVILSMLLSMVLSIKVCPTNTITEEQGESSMSILGQLVLLSINKLGIELFPKGFISVLSISDSQPVVKNFYQEFKQMIRKNNRQTRKDKEFQQRGKYPSQLVPSTSLNQIWKS